MKRSDSTDSFDNFNVRRDEEASNDSFDEFPATAEPLSRQAVLERLRIRRVAESIKREGRVLEELEPEQEPENAEDSFETFGRHVKVEEPPEIPAENPEEAATPQPPQPDLQRVKVEMPETSPQPPATPPPTISPLPEAASSSESLIRKAINLFEKEAAADPSKRFTMMLQQHGDDINLNIQVLSSPQKNTNEPSISELPSTSELPPPARSRASSSGSSISNGRRSAVRRRIRIESDSDSESSNEEQRTPRTTPRRVRVEPSVTPSPAKRLRGLNLGEQDSPSSGSSQEDEEDMSEFVENDSQDTEDDPDYVPDSQEDRDRPSDFRVPKNAVPDSLDLDYD